MRGYIIVSSQASDEQRSKLDAANSMGGAKHISSYMRWVFIPFYVAAVFFIVAWTQTLREIALASVLLTGAWAYFGQKRLRGIFGHDWLTTEDPKLIKLDKAWRELAAKEPDARWQYAVDQQRFVRIRQLAEMDADAAAPLIHAELERILQTSGHD